MTSRQLKALRRRQAREAVDQCAYWLHRHEVAALAADQAGLLNEAIFHTGKAAYWRLRSATVADPQFNATKRRRGANQGAQNVTRG